MSRFVDKGGSSSHLESTTFNLHKAIKKSLYEQKIPSNETVLILILSVKQNKKKTINMRTFISYKSIVLLFES